MSHVPVSLALICPQFYSIFERFNLRFNYNKCDGSAPLQRLCDILQLYWLVWFDAQVIFKTSHQPDT